MKTIHRIRIEDLSPVRHLTEDEMAEIVGAGRRKQVTRLVPAQVQVLEVREMMSATMLNSAPVSQAASTAVQSATAAVPPELVPLVNSAVQQLQAHSGSFSQGLGNVKFVGSTAQQQLQASIQNMLGQALAGGSAAGGQANGLSVVSTASPQEIQGFLTQGSSASQDLVVLRFQQVRTEVAVLQANSQEVISIGSTAVPTNTTGTVTGTLEVTTDITFGIDRHGRVYVLEGSTVQAQLLGQGNLQAQANQNGKVGVNVQSGSQLQAKSGLTVDDGDATPGERLYLATGSTSGNLPFKTSLTGNVQFSNSTADFMIQGLKSPVRTAGSGFWDFGANTGSFSFNQDMLLDAMSGAVGQAVAGLAGKANQLLDKVSDIPVVGDEIEAQLKGQVQNQLSLNLPESNIRAYLEQRGFRIQSMATMDQLLSGNLQDVFVITWQRNLTGSQITTQAQGIFGKTGGIQFDVAGNLTVTPETRLEITFGLDAQGGLFIQEGSTVGVYLHVAGQLEGNAKIPNLVNVGVAAQAPAGKSLIDASLKLKIDDGDQLVGERIYLGDLFTSQVAALDVDAGVNVEATLTTNSPLQQLPAMLQPVLQGLLPAQLSWTAIASYDFKSGELKYDLNNDALNQVVAAFQNANGVEDAIKNFMLQKAAENTPIPASMQEFLGKKIPLLDQNVMDLLDIPQSMQMLIAPLAFMGQSTTSIPNDGVTFKLDLFTPTNLGKLLSGQAYDIVSMQLNQRFEKSLGSITVVPETVVASYLGIINATMEVTLTPGFFVGVAMQMGFDSDQGFYVVGDTNGGVGKDVKPHFAIGGNLTANIIAEADLVFVLDFLRVTGSIGLEAFGDFTLVSPHGADSKMRLSDINPEQIALGLGVDLLLGLKGEVGILDYTNFVATTQTQSRHEIYRHRDGTTLADVERQLLEFKEDLKSKGKTALFAAAAVVPDPHVIAAALYVLHGETQSYTESARRLVMDHGAKVINVARGLQKAFDAKVGQIAAAIWSSCRDNVNQFAEALRAVDGTISEVASEVWSKLNGSLQSNLNKLAGALQAAKASTSEIATELAKRTQGSLEALAGALNSIGVGLGDIATQVWSRAGNDLNKLAGALRAVTSDLGAIATQVWSRAGNDLNKLAGALRAVTSDLGAIATQVWSRAGNDLNKLAGALRAVTSDLGAIATQVWSRAGNDLNKLAGALKTAGASIGDIATQVWNRAGGDLKRAAAALRAAGGTYSDIVRNLLSRAGNSVDAIAGALASVGASMSEIASRIWLDISWSTYRNVASALGSVSRDAGAIATAMRGALNTSFDTIADAMWYGISWTSYRNIATGLGAVTRDAGAIASAMRGALNTSFNTIADAMWYGISWTSYRNIATGLGAVTRDAGAIASAMRGALSTSFNTIADAMWYGISWTSYRNIATGLGAVTRDAGAIASAMRGALNTSFNTIADAMWYGISWTTHRNIAAGLGAVTRDAGAIASAMRGALGTSFNTIADAMWHGISWTSYTDIANGLKSVTKDANAIASALKNGAGAADATIRSVLQSVGSGLANLNSAINSVSSAVNKVTSSLPKLPSW